jgi:hypothetical protein
MEYSPLLLVVVPICDPLILIFTPASGSPFLSVTLPFIGIKAFLSDQLVETFTFSELAAKLIPEKVVNNRKIASFITLNGLT